MSEFVPTLHFGFDNVNFERQDWNQPWEVLLGMVGDFWVQTSERKLYEEQEFCLIEIAVELSSWLDNGFQRGADWLYTSIESDDEGLVWLKKVQGGWNVGSIHQAYADNSVFTSETIQTAAQAYLETLQTTLQETFGVDLAKFIANQQGLHKL